jgi:CRISPR/Cas system CSM-associated protein Csm3 (group 7 of RAMP superfamily)
MNPYDFVPVNFSIVPERHCPKYHGSFDGISGTLSGTITADTPIFIKHGNSIESQKNRKQKYIIPGTSLKGLFRSILETIANGCFGDKFSGIYSDKERGDIDLSSKLPHTFKKCDDPDQLCTACRIFGMLSQSGVHSGNVSFQDAVCEHKVKHKHIYTVDLMGPKPHHTVWYLKGDKIAGRKFYFHHPQGLVIRDRKTKHNQEIQPLGKGSKFLFTADFKNLEQAEWSALLYAIVLEENMRHKIGYAKPSGLGSVKIEIIHIRLIDFKNRYSSSNRGITDYTDDLLTSYIIKQIKPFIENKSSTLSELRRIWKWDGKDTTRYQYPTTDWFQKNPNASISQTP